MNKQMIKLGRLLDEDYSKFLEAMPRKLKFKLSSNLCNHPYFAHKSKNIHNTGIKLKGFPQVTEVTIFKDWCSLCGQKFHKNYSYQRIDKKIGRVQVTEKVHNYITGLTRFKRR